MNVAFSLEIQSCRRLNSSAETEGEVHGVPDQAILQKIA